MAAAVATLKSINIDFGIASIEELLAIPDFGVEGSTSTGAESTLLGETLREGTDGRWVGEVDDDCQCGTAGRLVLLFVRECGKGEPGRDPVSARGRSRGVNVKASSSCLSGGDRGLGLDPEPEGFSEGT